MGWSRAAKLASYPYIITRTYGMVEGSTSVGQKMPFFVHVLLWCPRNPWTKIILHIVGKPLRNVEQALTLLQLALLRIQHCSRANSRQSLEVADSSYIGCLALQPRRALLFWEHRGDLVFAREPIFSPYLRQHWLLLPWISILVPVHPQLAYIFIINWYETKGAEGIAAWRTREGLIMACHVPTAAGLGTAK
jgi:hypothetical protein